MREFVRAHTGTWAVLDIVSTAAVARVISRCGTPLVVLIDAELALVGLLSFDGIKTSTIEVQVLIVLIV